MKKNDYFLKNTEKSCQNFNLVLICGKMWKNMSQHYFNGSHIAKLDQKNRFVLPIQMRHGLIEDGELQCTLALGQNGSLVIYKKSEIETIVERFRKKQHSPHF